jgi:predicted glycosyltransferase involved in capsule biosynthesis
MSKLSIIIPYRNRAAHLAQFLKHYRPRLPKAEFLVIEQSIHKPFNRGLIKNIGALESKADYFLFHDVDMLAQGRIDYSYTEHPTHFATHASQFAWKMPHDKYFGGVVGFNRADFEKVNGYSNQFSGWGGEDDSLYYSVLANDLQIVSREHRYLSLPHPKDHPIGYDPVKMELAKRPRLADDGLNNCKYRIIGERQIPQGRIITVDI